MIYVDIDFETRSTVDLKKCGLAKYARSPETEVLCFVLSTGEEGIVNDIATLKCLAEDPEVIFRAHSAAFEMQIMEHKFGLIVPPERWRCSAALARSYGLPASLGACGATLGLTKQKDEEGKKIMLETCKPLAKNRKQHGHGERPANALDFNWEDDRYAMDAEKYEKLVAYCVDDVLSEEAIFDKLGCLIEQEQKLWERDYVINYVNGISIDTELCASALEVFNEKCEEINEECKATHGFSLRQPAEVAKFLGLPNAKSDTLRDADLREMDEQQEWVLNARKTVANTSPKKYQAALNMNVDNKMYGALMYHGAERTGRWAGRGFQTQNIPRGSFNELWVDEEMELAVNYIKQGRIEELNMDWMDAVKSCLRGVIDGPVAVCDYSQIESRVLAWMAGDEDKLEVFRSGKDVYKAVGTRVRGKKYEDATKEDRTFGKVCELAGGFGGGAGAFMNAGRINRMPLDEEKAEETKKAWRKANKHVVRLWYRYEEDAIATISDGGRHGVFHIDEDFLYLNLPSGRTIKYYKPELREDTRFGKMSVTFLTVPTDADRIVERGVIKGTRLARVSTYGAKFVQNRTQCIARDLMADAFMKLPEHAVCFTVHDEIVSQSVSLGLLENAMLNTPDWSKGLPVAVDGFESPRYRK